MEVPLKDPGAAPEGPGCWLTGLYPIICPPLPYTDFLCEGVECIVRCGLIAEKVEFFICPPVRANLDKVEFLLLRLYPG